jgi:hypothetical protein
MLVRALVFCASTLVLAGCGVTGNFRHDPGYAEFGSLKRLDSQSDFGLSLGPLPLKIARWALEDDTELRPLLEELRAVRVYTFEGVRDAAVAADVDELTAELVRDGWLNIIAIREGAERTSVLLRPGAAGANRGLTVIVQQPSEVVLVNLIGNVRLDLINGYMTELEVEAPVLTIDPATLQAASSPVEHVRHEQ